MSMKPATKVDKDVLAAANLEVIRAEGQRKAMVAVYKAEAKVPVRVPPMYKPYFGSVMQVMINGISIAIKIDGSIQEVPQTFADETAERMMKIDMIENKKTRMSDVTNNLDVGAPGQLQMF